MSRRSELRPPSARFTDSALLPPHLLSSYQVDADGLLPVLLVVDAGVVDDDVQMSEQVCSLLEGVCLKRQTFGYRRRRAADRPGAPPYADAPACDCAQTLPPATAVSIDDVRVGPVL